MNPARRAIHLDFHTMPGIRDIARDFCAETFVRTLKEARVDSINVFARCNLGFAYYPTALGIPYPGLEIDLLGEMVEACRKEGIQVIAYFNLGLDHEHALRHREWCKVTREGHVYEHQKMGNFFRKMCLNTGYGPHLLAMIDEVLEKYPVDGLFLDCINLSPCYGIECLDGMKQAGMNPLDEKQATEFCWKVTEEFRQEVIRLAEKKRGDLKICFNGLPFRRQPSHIELEVLPLGGWGYEVLPWQIRYARTLGKPYLTMTGRFQGEWGDFGGLRPEHSLLFDCCNSLANGGRCSVGDHLHPRGRLEPAVYEMIGKVYERVERLEPFLDGAKSVTEMAIVNPRLKDYPGDSSFSLLGIMGATRMLSELKYQFDVSDGEGDLSGYRVIVLPDDVVVDEGLKTKLKAHLSKGGAVISSAFAGLNPERTAFALEEYRLCYHGPEVHNPTFFVAEPEVSRDLPQMPLTIYLPGVAMEAAPGAQVLAKLMRAYFEHGSWDGFHENLYTPPDVELGRPALVQSGNLFHFSFPVFSGYSGKAVVAYRHLVRNCIERVFPDPLVKVSGLPSFGQVTVTRNGMGRMVHLVTYLPELRGEKTQMIEEPITIREMKISLRREERTPRAVYLASSRAPLGCGSQGDYLEVTVPEVSGHEVVVFED